MSLYFFRTCRPLYLHHTKHQTPSHVLPPSSHSLSLPASLPSSTPLSSQSPVEVANRGAQAPGEHGPRHGGSSVWGGARSPAAPPLLPRQRSHAWPKLASVATLSLSHRAGPTAAAGSRSGRHVARDLVRVGAPPQAARELDGDGGGRSAARPAWGSWAVVTVTRI